MERINSNISSEISPKAQNTKKINVRVLVFPEINRLFSLKITNKLFNLHFF